MSPAPSANSIKTGDDERQDYTIVTEIPNGRASQEQIARLCTRYKFASDYCVDREVLEVACGAGLGLGYLARFAKRVVGGDIDKGNLSFAAESYKDTDKISVLALDAHNLPFKDNSFDVVILYEAIYYLLQPERFVEEARRVLRDKGVLIICTVNKDWSGFDPSPLSHRYFSANELYSLLNDKGFAVKLYADGPTQLTNLKTRLVSIIRLIAVKLNLLPKTMKGKEMLKRIFCGKLTLLPAELTDDIGISYTPPVPIPHDSPNTSYKILFAVGRLS